MFYVLTIPLPPAPELNYLLNKIMAKNVMFAFYVDFTVTLIIVCSVYEETIDLPEKL